VRGYIGNGIPRLVKRLLTGQSRQSPTPRCSSSPCSASCGITATPSSHRPAFPGVVDGSERMRAGLRLACVTNKARAFTERCSRRSGWRITSSSCSRRQPALEEARSRALLHIAERFGVQPAQLLMVGDSDNDARARRRRLPVLCVPYGYRGETALRIWTAML